jgi:hypothetical protein
MGKKLARLPAVGLAVSQFAPVHAEKSAGMNSSHHPTQCNLHLTSRPSHPMLPLVLLALRCRCSSAGVSYELVDAVDAANTSIPIADVIK